MNGAYQEIINKAFKELLDNVMKPNYVLSIFFHVQDNSDLTTEKKWFAVIWDSLYQTKHVAVFTLNI